MSSFVHFKHIFWSCSAHQVPFRRIPCLIFMTVGDQSGMVIITMLTMDTMAPVILGILEDALIMTQISETGIESKVNTIFHCYCSFGLKL